MAGRFRIRCINKVPRDDPYDRIDHVGGFGTSQWKLPVSVVIARIKSGDEAFYVERPNGDQVDVIVAVSRFGNEYIRTTADGDLPNNLLDLPECP